MKSSKLILIISAVTALSSMSCQKGGIWGIKGQGNTISEVRDLAGFSGINLLAEANVQYTQDSIYSVEIRAQKNILAVLETKIEGGQLIIDFRRTVWSHNDINIIIHSPNMNKISISGSGNIDAQNKMAINSLELTIIGSGNISVPNVTLQTLTAKISGSGNINVNAGTCISEYFNMSGSGNINTEFLTTINNETKFSGSGNIRLNVSDVLNVNISGSGNVSYRGKPTISASINGSGRLIHLD